MLRLLIQIAIKQTATTAAEQMQEETLTTCSPSFTVLVFTLAFILMSCENPQPMFQWIFAEGTQQPWNWRDYRYVASGARQGNPILFCTRDQYLLLIPTLHRVSYLKTALIWSSKTRVLYFIQHYVYLVLTCVATDTDLITIGYNVTVLCYSLPKCLVLWSLIIHFFHSTLDLHHISLFIMKAFSSGTSNTVILELG